ncbi:MAG TPA: hypothetical protein VIM16_02000 [Mucilaginibacter sp.]
MDGIDVNQCSDSLIEAIDGFVHNFKIQVLKNVNNQPVSTGLLFTWIPIVAILSRFAKDIYALKFQAATAHLESEVHKFAIIHLNHALNKQATWLNDKQSQSQPVNFYKFKRSQPSLN